MYYVLCISMSYTVEYQYGPEMFHRDVLFIKYDSKYVTKSIHHSHCYIKIIKIHSNIKCRYRIKL